MDRFLDVEAGSPTVDGTVAAKGRHTANAAQRYCLSMFGIFLLTTLPVAALNYAHDPYGYFARLTGRPQMIGREECKTRTAKAEILLGRNWNTALLGSSRVETGFNPQLFGTGTDVCNLGLSATCIQETRYVSQLAVQQPGIQRLMVCVDFSSFGDNASPARDFAQSLFSPDRGIAEHGIANLFGWRPTSVSWRRLRGQTDDPMIVEPNGFREGQEQSAEVQRQRIEDQLTRFVSVGQDNPFCYSGVKMSEFRSLLEVCQAAAKPVDVVILPTHALYLEIMQRQGNWSAFEHWKRDLVRVVCEVYPQADRPVIFDFTDYSGVNSEAIPSRDRTAAPMKWYWEVAHFRSVLGTRVMEIVNDREESSRHADPLVVREIDQANLEATLDSIRQGRELYLRQQPQDVELLQQLFERSAPPSAAFPLAG